jgi:sarcosine oxidase subunit beta
MRSADVVVVGAGVIGCSIAWHLASAGVRRIVVIDRGPAPGEGSTAKATGGFRCQFGSESNILLSLLSREKLLRFQSELGLDSGYDPIGYLFLAASDQQVSTLQSLVTLQQSLGVPSRMVSEEEAEAINPAIAPGSHRGGSFCPIDGTIRPMNLLRGYYEAALRLGVEFIFDDAPVSLEVSSRGVETVRTGRQSIACGSLVDAAGAWAADVAALAGIELPVTPLRRFVVPTMPTTVLPADMALTIFLADGFHLRVRDGRVLLLWPHEPRSDHASTHVSSSWIETVERLAHERIPLLRDVALDRAAAWGGLYELSPDRHVILGPDSAVPNFFFANGSSGHGVMHSPAIGQLTAELICGVATAMDIAPLQIDRFARGSAISGEHLL